MTSITGNIFATVAEKDYLEFYKNKQPVYNRIKEFLNFKNEDIARATGVPENSVRFDERIPPEVQTHMVEWANALNLVAEHFKGDANKTILWFTTPNPLLGNIAPRDMIRFGRYKKLFKFIYTALAENKMNKSRYN